MGERGTDQPIDRESHPPMRCRRSNHSRRPSLEVPERSTDRLLRGVHCGAGTDRVAVDSYGYTHLLERDIAELTYIHKANDRGLGNMDWKQTRYKEVQA